MRIDDVNTFKGKAKTAMQSWANKQIDQVMKDMPRQSRRSPRTESTTLCVGSTVS